MNAVIQRLRAEVTADVATFEARIDELAALPPFSKDPAPLAQAAVALHHAYGAVESALLRVARALEGDPPDGPDWHQALLMSMSLQIEGVRPAVLSAQTVTNLRHLLSFRHFFRHAYSVDLDPLRLEELRRIALTARPVVRDDFGTLDRLLQELATH
ncbi:MAG: hypothetical protein ABMA15_26950 [Vicinamibacterales bacterium]